MDRQCLAIASMNGTTSADRTFTVIWLIPFMSLFLVRYCVYEWKKEKKMKMEEEEEVS